MTWAIINPELGRRNGYHDIKNTASFTRPEKFLAGGADVETIQIGSPFSSQANGYVSEPKLGAVAVFVQLIPEPGTRNPFGMPC
jgi:hypothetical protein